MVVTEDTKELAHDLGEEGLDTLPRRRDVPSSTFVAQLDPATRAREGSQIELVADTDRLHFFDPGTGLGIYGDAEA
jgi:multiple sugar transport system ATP-binding protein